MQFTKPMSFILVSYLSTICAFVWEVVYSLWSYDATVVRAIEVNCVGDRAGKVTTMDNVEAQADVEATRVSDSTAKLSTYTSAQLDYFATHCPWYTVGEEAVITIEPFAPSKIVEAMERYRGTGPSETPNDFSFSRESALSADTTITEEDDCFSEGQSIASSATTVDDVGDEKCNVVRGEGEVAGGVGDEKVMEPLDSHDLFDDSERLSCLGGCVRGRKAGVFGGKAARNTLLEYYFSSDAIGDDGIAEIQGIERLAGAGSILEESQPAYERIQQMAKVIKGIATSSREEKSKTKDTEIEREHKAICDVLEEISVGQVLVRAAMVVKQPSGSVHSPPGYALLLSPVPDVHILGRPTRNTEEKLCDLLNFMEECDFILPDLSFGEASCSYYPRETPRFGSDDCVAQRDIHGGLVLPNSELQFPMGRNPCLERIEEEEFTPRIVVQSPSLDIFPLPPIRPRRAFEEGLAEVLEFMDNHDNELPICAAVESDSVFKIRKGISTRGISLRPLCKDYGGLGPHVLAFMEGWRYDHMIESGGEHPNAGKRRTTLEGDVFELSQRSPIDAPWTPAFYDSTAKLDDLFQGVKTADGVDFAYGRDNRANIKPDLGEEFDAIFDIVDKFGISIEEGLAFFEKASEWFTVRAKDEARRLKCRLGDRVQPCDLKYRACRLDFCR
ncbi:hypothetical protein D9756_011200 [Leucocoprinus leucothites]|uniref:Uncharacterized protein n=1 Tax=Leucocoprinus leucothites TaxID=201217 RepID=A0A8H5CQP9_9AGAR|nr:hypothetical protein D9756_011200 [Leucoagaricus leucothites]